MQKRNTIVAVQNIPNAIRPAALIGCVILPSRYTKNVLAGPCNGIKCLMVRYRIFGVNWQSRDEACTFRSKSTRNVWHAARLHSPWRES